MPCLHIITNLNLDGVDTNPVFSELTAAVSTIIGKPEKLTTADNGETAADNGERHRTGANSSDSAGGQLRTETRVTVGRKPVTGLRLGLEGNKQNRLAIHLQHFVSLPKNLLPHLDTHVAIGAPKKSSTSLTKKGSGDKKEDTSTHIGKLAKIVDTTEMFKGPQDIPGHWLSGRGTVEFTIEKGDGSTYSPVGGEQKNTATIQVVIDRYSASLTAGNFAKPVMDGAYNGAKLNSINQAILSDNGVSQCLPENDDEVKGGAVASSITTAAAKSLWRSERWSSWKGLRRWLDNELARISSTKPLRQWGQAMVACDER
ncbi:Peptidyl-prolyl cis-trans isomerase [Vigna angularis]|uniref:Peptidyl-prolyl cis-trans isomerase n=1 Tax=Phaseolus angularis TaxID=3914 RepID=A0A8T0KZD9_PHAAN|nr:Peptidyl-prolyl cis-trans isomerase [Vigna angularis]